MKRIRVDGDRRRLFTGGIGHRDSDISGSAIRKRRLDRTGCVTGRDRELGRKSRKLAALSGRYGHVDIADLRRADGHGNRDGVAGIGRTRSRDTDGHVASHIASERMSVNERTAVGCGHQ